MLFNERHDGGGDEDVDERDLEEVEPADAHELIVTETGKRPADPNEEEEQAGDLGEESGDVDEAEDDAAEAGGELGGIHREEGNVPAAEEEDHDERAAGD